MSRDYGIAMSEQIRINAAKDPSYCPYCGRCNGLIRMVKVAPLLWQCKCGAIHDERPQGTSTKLGIPTNRKWWEFELKSLAYYTQFVYEGTTYRKIGEEPTEQGIACEFETWGYDEKRKYRRRTEYKYLPPDTLITFPLGTMKSPANRQRPPYTNPDLAKYERNIFNGTIPCPFTVQHKDKEGNLITDKPIPCTPSGRFPKGMTREEMFIKLCTI